MGNPVVEILSDGQPWGADRLGWTLYGFQAAAALFAPRPQAIFIQYPVYQAPAAVIIQR